MMSKFRIQICILFASVTVSVSLAACSPNSVAPQVKTPTRTTSDVSKNPRIEIDFLINKINNGEALTPDDFEKFRKLAKMQLELNFPNGSVVDPKIMLNLPLSGEKATSLIATVILKEPIPVYVDIRPNQATQSNGNTFAVCRPSTAGLITMSGAFNLQIDGNRLNFGRNENTVFNILGPRCPVPIPDSKDEKFAFVTKEIPGLIRLINIQDYTPNRVLSGEVTRFATDNATGNLNSNIVVIRFNIPVEGELLKSGLPRNISGVEFNKKGEAMLDLNKFEFGYRSK